MLRLLLLVLVLVACGGISPPAFIVFDITPRKETQVQWEIKVWNESGTPKTTVAMDGAQVASTGLQMRVSGKAFNGRPDCIEAVWTGNAALGIRAMDYIQIRLNDGSGWMDLWYGQVRRAPSPDNPDDGNYRAVGLSQKRLLEVIVRKARYSLQDAGLIGRDAVQAVIAGTQLGSNPSNILIYDAALMPLLGASLEIYPQNDSLGNLLQLVAGSVTGGATGVGPDKKVWVGVPNSAPLVINLDGTAVNVQQNAIAREDMDIDAEEKVTVVQWMLPKTEVLRNALYYRHILNSNQVFQYNNYDPPQVYHFSRNGTGPEYYLSKAPMVVPVELSAYMDYDLYYTGEPSITDPAAIAAITDGSKSTFWTASGGTYGKQLIIYFKLTQAAVTKLVGFELEGRGDVVFGAWVRFESYNSSVTSVTEVELRSSSLKGGQYFIIDDEMRTLLAQTGTASSPTQIQIALQIPANTNIDLISARPIQVNETVLNNIAGLYFTPDRLAPKNVTLAGYVAPSDKASVTLSGITTHNVRVEELEYSISADDGVVTRIALEQKPNDADDLANAALDRWVANQSTVDAVRAQRR